MLSLLVLIACAVTSTASSDDSLPAVNIISGNDVAQPGKWAWQCSLQDIDGHYCGCSYLGSHWVLTAAHCVQTKAAELIEVVVGAHDIKTLKQGSPETIAVQSYTVHENFKDGSAIFANDIALVKLSQAPGASEFVAAAALAPNDDETYVGYNCYFTGWGNLEPGSTPDILQEANVDASSTDDCNDVTSPLRVTDDVVCFVECGTAIAQGDSGGPAQCERDGRWVQVGVGSWVMGYQTSVFTRISSYYDWIMLNSNNLS